MKKNHILQIKLTANQFSVSHHLLKEIQTHWDGKTLTLALEASNSDMPNS